MVSKKLTSKCSVTIPKSIRLHLGWNGSMAVDLQVTDDGALLIKPHIDTCRFCGTHEDVSKYQDICVCPECAGKMKGALTGGN